jgi:hypothetical protein
MSAVASRVKITSKFDPDKWHATFNPNFQKRKKKGNVCCACGKPLTDEISKKRGYGPECWKQVPVIITLDIRKAS